MEGNKNARQKANNRNSGGSADYRAAVLESDDTLGDLNHTAPWLWHRRPDLSSGADPGSRVRRVQGNRREKDKLTKKQRRKGKMSLKEGMVQQ